MQHKGLLLSSFSFISGKFYVSSSFYCMLNHVIKKDFYHNFSNNHLLFSVSMAKSDTLWIFCTFLMGSLCNVIFGATNEHRLLNNLLMEYQKYERPVANESLPVSLNFSLSLQQIIDLDERNQLLITNLWLDYTWEDVNLQWNKVINLSYIFLREN